MTMVCEIFSVRINEIEVNRQILSSDENTMRMVSMPFMRETIIYLHNNPVTQY
jgi:hypothetical protein